MKACRECNRTLPLTEFYAHAMMADGHLNKCKDCVKVRVRRYTAATRPERSSYERKRTSDPWRKIDRRESQRRHRARHPERNAARQAVRCAVRSGRLVRGPCVYCGTTVKVQAHHDDYSKPLEVTWACFRCHRERKHGQVVVAA